MKNQHITFEPPVGSLFDKQDMRAIERVLLSGETLSRGKDIPAFEQEFAAFCDVPYAVAVSSGTASLRIAVQLLRLGKGDEVIIPCNAFWNAIVPYVERGVTLKVADVDGYTLAPDAKHIESLITKKTKAILIMSLGGDPGDMAKLVALAKKRGITLIEDAAHSVGSSYKGKRIGSFCDISCFSFASLKNMTTLGEGGMLTTPHKHFADEAAKLRESWPIGQRKERSPKAFGQYAKPADANFMRAGDAFDFDWLELEEVGTNYKMTSVAAAVGRTQLKKIPKFNDKRRAIAELYDSLLKKIPGVQLRKHYPATVSSCHLYNFFLTEKSGVDRDELVHELSVRHGMQYIHRFWPIHLHGVLRMDGHKLGEAPVYEKLWFKELMCLPIAPSMSMAQVKWVAERVIETCADLRKKR